MRRHPEIPKIRAALEALLQFTNENIPETLRAAAKREKLSLHPLQDLWMHEREVFSDHGFETELILAICGLNAWISKRDNASSYWAIPSGTWPLDEAPKRCFEKLVTAFRFGRRPRHALLDGCPVVDLLQSVSADAVKMEWLKKDLSCDDIPQDDPRQALAGDELKFRLLLEKIDVYRRWGYEVAVLAYDPSPIQKESVLSALSTSLLKKAKTSPKKTAPPSYRPRPEQFRWIFEIENGNTTNSADFHRLFTRVRFPLMPCAVDPDNRDTIERRICRIKDALVAKRRTLNR
jgi:hypothetical protein